MTTGSGSRYFLSSDSAVGAQRAAQQAMRAAKPGATISLFKFSGGEEVKSAPAPALKAAPKKSSVPPGVPSLVSWRKNRDGSITGFISESTVFEEGERITTSPIARGEVKAGEVVQTGSGSKYFLV